MTDDDTLNGLHNVSDKGLLGYVNANQHAVVTAVRGVQENIVRLAAAAFRHHGRIVAMEQRHDALSRRLRDVEQQNARIARIIAPLTEPSAQSVRRVVDLRLRVSPNPCVECDAIWKEPTKRGRMASRCPDCR